ncbi:MAG: type IX secretion system membrane protein PorP/SprF [Lewinellaceae bacterium]|nr:type IX secretion system membrane protein PorP/SprF [Lewinellaceae bacterium]
MKTRLTCCLFLLILFSASGSAQQTPYASFYRANWQMVNPAAIDRSYYLSRHHNTLVFNSAFRQQWIGVDGAPRTYFASVEWCPEQESKYVPGMKLGGTLIRDRTDAISTTSFLANYGYFFHLGRSQGHVLHLGLSGRINQYHIDAEALRLKDNNDPVYQGIQAQPNYLYGDVALGMLYRVGQYFYAGLSIPSALKVNMSRQSDSLNIAREIRRHYFAMTGGYIPFGPEDPTDRDKLLYTFEPSFWMRYVPGVEYSTLFNGAPFSFDANLRVHYRNQFWVGVGYGSNHNAQVETGFTVRWNDHPNDVGTRLQAGLAYSFPAGNKLLAIGHSFELTLSYWGL